MANTGWHLPGTTSQAQISNTAYDWSNPGNITSNDSAYADVVGPLNEIPTAASDIIGRNYGFNVDIPAGATIDGISMRSERYADNFGFAYELKDQQQRADVNVGTDQANPATLWATATPTLVTFGGSTDTMGYAATEALVTTSNYGYSIEPTLQGFDFKGAIAAHAYIDYMQMKIWYTEAANTDPIIGTSTVTDYNSVTANWTDTSDGEGGFELQYRANGGSWTALTTTAAGVETYAWNSATEGTLYEFRVRATTGSKAASGWSATSADVYTPPRSPSGQVAAEQPNGDVIINWSDNSSKEINYTIRYRRNGAATATLSSTLPASTTQYTMTEAQIDSYTINPGDSLVWRISAQTANSNSESYDIIDTAAILYVGPSTFKQQTIVIS
jgi:hypothetical protein